MMFRGYFDSPATETAQYGRQVQPLTLNVSPRGEVYP